MSTLGETYAIPGEMTAVVAETRGGPDVLKPVRRSVTRPAAGEVLIAVAAAGVNRPDAMQRSGAVPAPPGVSDILGLEVAGRIVACGEAVERSLLGAEVMALVKAGGYASHVCARADHCLPIPTGLSSVEAAALPEGLFTIWHNLFERGELRSGETVLLEGERRGLERWPFNSSGVLEERSLRQRAGRKNARGWQKWVDTQSTTADPASMILSSPQRVGEVSMSCSTFSAATPSIVILPSWLRAGVMSDFRS